MVKFLESGGRPQYNMMPFDGYSCTHACEEDPRVVACRDVL
jgi:hypothetical protein